MNVYRFLIAILSLLVLSAPGLATELSRCLSMTNNQEHRLQKEDTIRYCFNKYKVSISKDSCYTALTKQTPKMSSAKLIEEIKSICFYETNSSKDMNSCLSETKKFKNSANHDEAIFYCFMHFQDSLSKKDCIKTASQLIYPLKKEYLKQYCYSYN